MTTFSRRNLLAGTVGLAAAAPLAANANAPIDPSASASAAPSLRFGDDGTFRIIQFNDTQDDHLTDQRTIEFQRKVLDEQKPDFVVINGDVISSGPTNNTEVYQAINNVVLPMEERGIPWAITFGNHDEDSTEDAGTGVYEPQMVEFVRQYKHNLNPAATDTYGDSDGLLLVNGTAGTPKFAVWLFDSGRYAPENPGGQEIKDMMGYDWLRPQQIDWYRTLSEQTEQTYGTKVPGLMFFHIPTYEHHHMWFGQQFSSEGTGPDERFGVIGVKNEDCYTGLINSGIYSAVRERGDVLGIYCGHDHINSYMGNYFGVELGYCPGTGFGPYGLRDGTWDMHTLRGARIFNLDEKTERVYTDTSVVFAKDMGLDMNPIKQPLKAPLPFPDYVQPVN
ncbi:metallophosphoesterase family protein [Corynebacterium uterequi]|uniref:Putative phosphoesterase n=1 Tax=Corynebacterium uterequi TaxID=1072256 RepID=A0A0G3HBY3_9CORY|nr:metallophosphoesterase family protein [Corynebacterium uterequi]AKK10906.1 putative phosphoesterase [Corynebacterium uterequi]